MRIAFIGIGQIGEPMALNLIKAGFELVVHDLLPSKATRLVEAGASWAASPAAAAAASNVVITSLPGPAEARQVIEGTNGVLETIQPGTTWIEMSTTDSEELRRLAERLNGRGACTLEAPVSGGVPNAWKGKVTIYVGGPKDEFENRRAVFEGIGDRIFYMGPLGAGQATKLIGNMLSFVHHAALGEGLVLGVRAGLDLWTLRDAIQAGYGASFVCEEGAPMIFNGSYNPHFTLDLAMKDFMLAKDFADRVGAVWTLIPFVMQAYERARSRYGGTVGLSSVVRLTEDASGASLVTGKAAQLDP